jgi:hypothetical protein
MKDYKLIQRNLRASHTLGWCLFIEKDKKRIFCSKNSTKLFLQVLLSVLLSGRYEGGSASIVNT